MMRSKSIWSFLFLITILSLAACSSSDSDSTSTSDSADDLGAGVRAVFSSGASSRTSASLSKGILNLFLRQAQAEGECSTTCSCVGDDGPDNITTSATGTAGTYGADTDTTDTMVVTADHFCSVSTSTTGGPDGSGQFATFDFASAVTANCTAADLSTSTTTISAGSGIWRNTSTHEPEVYGSFTVDSVEYDCTIFILSGESGEVDGDNSNCVDADGVSVTIADDSTCTISE